MHRVDIGAWQGDDLGESYDSYVGVSYYSNQDPTVQFKHGVAKAIRRRLEKKVPHENILSVFILAPGPLNDFPSTSVPRLNSGLTPLNGIWFVNRQVISGKRIEINSSDDTVLFDFVISTLGAGEFPAILFDVAESKRLIRFYPRGLQHMDDCDELAIDVRDLGLAEVRKAIDFTYKERLITPSAGAYGVILWKKPDDHWTIDQIERKIQSHLVTGLANWFLPCKVQEELTGASGRYDVSIIEQHPLDASHKIHHVLLEIKVIKSFGSGGAKVSLSANMSGLKTGLEQAYCYRKEHNFKFSALCCFDMQKENNGDTCFNHIQDDAKKLAVELWHWYIHNKAKDLRSLETAKALND